MKICSANFRVEIAWISENVGNMRQVSYEELIHLMMFAAFKAHHIVHDNITNKDLGQIAAKFGYGAELVLQSFSHRHECRCCPLI